MRGFGYCAAYNELRDQLRYRQCMGEVISPAEQRQISRARWAEMCAQF